MLWSVTGSERAQFAGGAQKLAGNFDVDGDGRCEVVAITSTTRESDVYVYNSSGSLRYVLPALANGWIAESVATLDDVDGDGGDDFVVGAHRPGIGGGVFVVSGRTGAIVRLSLDPQPGDVISGAVCNAGDVDLDGVDDYAAASYVFSRGTRIVIFSGATGAILQSWGDYWADYDSVAGGFDADLDGIPDLVVGSGGYQVAPNLWGQVRCYSGRDGSILWNHDTVSPADNMRPRTMIALGPQPGSPYPVIAWYDAGSFVSRIIALRTNPPGAGAVFGAPASSTTDLPSIGMRAVGTGSVRGTATDIRIQTAEGPPSALAWLLLAGADDLSFGGVTFPQPLDPLGLPGLTLYVPPFLVLPTQLGAQGADPGFGAIDLPIPSLNPTGIPFAAQWLLLDPATGAFAATARHEFRAL